jgi:hypothetical protein
MMTVLTPSQIREDVAKTLYPKSGCILCILAHSNSTSFIVAMPWNKVIDFIQDLIEDHKAWGGEIARRIVTKAPTLPLPETPVAPATLPIVKVDSFAKSVVWTFDNWTTNEGRIYDTTKKEWGETND